MKIINKKMVWNNVRFIPPKQLIWYRVLTIASPGIDRIEDAIKTFKGEIVL